MPTATEVIYLDNNSSTRIDPAVLEEMMPFLTTHYGNPSGSHRFGAEVKKAIDQAHERVAALLGCEPNEIVFTSGGTESDNTALHSALQMSPERRHIVTTSVEHNAVLNYCEALVRRGCEATIVPVDEQGHLDLGELTRAIRPEGRWPLRAAFCQSSASAHGSSSFVRTGGPSVSVPAPVLLRFTRPTRPASMAIAPSTVKLFPLVTSIVPPPIPKTIL